MVDRPTQSTPTDPNAEDDHADLLATLAAARELGPDMDKALADSYMQRRKANTPARPRNAAPRPPVNYGFVAQSVLPVILIATLIAAVVIFGHGWGWFFLFPLFWSGWWWRRGSGRGRGWYGYDDRYNRRRDYRDERRAEREESRRDDRYDWS
ncbi:MAG TPA: hypothetical protein VF510_10555 [Ktedonobacterales bacterium]